MKSINWLEDSASHAMDCLLARLDSTREFRPYFWVDFKASPPEARHSYWDTCDIAGRFVDGLALARLMTGRKDGKREEEALKKYFLAQQDDKDGLFYNPDDEQDTNTEMSKYLPEAGVLTTNRHVDLFCQRSPLLALTTLLQMGDQSMLPRLENFVRGLAAIAVKDGEEYSFPAYRWAVEMKAEWYHPVNLPEKWLGYRYALLTPLARYAEISGDVLARDLALGLSRHYLKHGDVPPDGRYRANTHSGGVLPVTAGIARLGLVFDKPELVEWARKVFDWTCQNTSEFGFLPDGLGMEGFWSGTCETCALADFVHLALVLNQTGETKYWDAIERLARNQLMENQYKDAEAVKRTFPGIAPEVLAMLLGGFECAAFPNDLFNYVGAEACCIGGGLRALYLTWRSVLETDKTSARVNMAATRSDSRVSVTAFEPWEGLVEVRVAQALDVQIRLPGFVREDQVTMTVDGVPIEVKLIDRKACFGKVKPGQKAALHYPLAESERDSTIAGNTYRTHWVGNTVVSIEPVGIRHPIYQRRQLLGQRQVPRVMDATRSYPSRLYW